MLSHRHVEAVLLRAAGGNDADGVAARNRIADFVPGQLFKKHAGNRAGSRSGRSSALASATTTAAAAGGCVLLSAGGLLRSRSLSENQGRDE